MLLWVVRYRGGWWSIVTTKTENRKHVILVSTKVMFIKSVTCNWMLNSQFKGQLKLHIKGNGKYQLFSLNSPVGFVHESI